jgi:hypothetical protein
LTLAPRARNPHDANNEKAPLRLRRWMRVEALKNKTG